MKHRLIYSLLCGMAVLGAGHTTVNASAAMSHVTGTQQGNSAYKFLAGITPIALGDFSKPNAQFHIRGDYTAMSWVLGNIPVDCSGKTGRFLVKEQNLPGAKNVVSLLDAGSLSSVDLKQLRDYLVIAAAYFRSTQGHPAESTAVTFSHGNIHSGGNIISFIEFKQSFSKFCTQVIALQSVAQTQAQPAAPAGYSAPGATSYPSYPTSSYGAPQPAQAAGYPTAAPHYVAPASVPSSRRPFDITAAVQAHLQPAATQPATPHAVHAGVYGQPAQAAGYPTAAASGYPFGYPQPGSQSDQRDVLPVDPDFAQHPAYTGYPAAPAGYPTPPVPMHPHVAGRVPGIHNASFGATLSPAQVAAIQARNAAIIAASVGSAAAPSAAGYVAPRGAVQVPATAGRGYASTPSTTLTPQQLAKIQNDAAALNPKRPGEAFTDAEYCIAANMLQHAPKNHGGYMNALCVVFSVQRAEAILNKFLEG
jgi:hypothetical protein